MSQDGEGIPPVLFRIYEGLDQLGPGDDEHTARALAGLGELPADPAVLDVGCGTGRQTLALARLTGGRVTAVDVHEPFLAQLRRRARGEGLGDRVRTEVADMASLPFEPGSFDLIWAEGSIYLMGFEAGLRAWRLLLRSGGRMAVSEISWLVDDPPPACREFWDENYPEMATVELNRDIARRAGYELLGDFPLPPGCWWGPYYEPLEAQERRLRPELGDEPVAAAMFEENRRERELFRRHADAYGYVFYLLEPAGCPRCSPTSTSAT